jgi:hypothetical protein
MNLSQLETQVKYVSNASGETTEVIVPVALWQALMDRLKPALSGLDPLDENEPKEQILADLQESLRAGVAGNHHPISKLWEGLDD